VSGPHGVARVSRPVLPKRWKELAPLFDAALDVEPRERGAFIDRACKDDTDLRAELEALLVECAESDRLFTVGAMEQFAPLLAKPRRGLPETVAERYRIGREIGTGGMATVYLARDLKHDRDVALKVVRADLSAILGAERFLAEVRITAKLDHPHILTLIDSGSADGLLFYVLPFVRGETLRAKLERERQLSLEDALSITRQVAAALDYAHTQGVIHRDVKPENILLHEGEAVLADFGIALAVKEAGGNRLTGSGLSLGTPEYMSPEQATGDRELDGRSDVYSLAAVLYEMLAGEPPITGASKQTVIAKLLTERPTRLSIVRAVPDEVDGAVDKALSKVPADRFATAGAFARALATANAVTLSFATRRVRRWTIVATLGVCASIVLVGLASKFARGKIESRPDAGIALADRRQLTITGQVGIPAISGDGKALAYRTTNCGASGCTFGVELQDVSSTSSHRLFDGASAVYDIAWSPNGRSLLVGATINQRRGAYLVSALGGTPHYVAFSASYLAGGDSLLFMRFPFPPQAKDKWLLVGGIDAVARDSIRIGGPGDKLSFFGAVPGSKWLVVGLYPQWLKETHVIELELRVLGRDGRVSSHKVVGHSGTNPEGHLSSDAVWFSPAGIGWPRRNLMRVALDAASGKLSSRVDTLFTALHTGFSVTLDGGSLVLDEGSADYKLWGLDLSEAIRGVFPEQKGMLRSTTPLAVRLSPDGTRIAVGRDPGAVVNALQRWSTVRFGDSTETPLALAGATAEVMWSDNATVAIRDRIVGGARLALVDPGSGTVHEHLDIPSRYPNAFARLPAGGWMWVSSFEPTLHTQLLHDSIPRQIPLPVWYFETRTIVVSHDGQFVGFSGSKAPSVDSLGVSVMSLTDGKVTSWFTATAAEGGDLDPLNDGSFLLRVHDTPETISLYHLLGPGRYVKLGAIPGKVSSLSVSGDLKHVAVVTREYRGDAWKTQVVRR